MTEQVDIAKEWLSSYYEDARAGRICAYTLMQYISELEAENERLANVERLRAMDIDELERVIDENRMLREKPDKLKEWLATGSVQGLCGEAKWKEGFLAAIYSVQELLEEQDQ